MVGHDLCLLLAGWTCAEHVSHVVKYVCIYRLINVSYTLLQSNIDPPRNLSQWSVVNPNQSLRELRLYTSENKFEYVQIIISHSFHKRGTVDLWYTPFPNQKFLPLYIFSIYLYFQFPRNLRTQPHTHWFPPLLPPDPPTGRPLMLAIRQPTSMKSSDLNCQICLLGRWQKW